MMDGRIVLKFLADILYLKGILYAQELEDIMDAKNHDDLDAIFEKVYRGEYSPYKRGECYVRGLIEGVGGSY